mmetsp:Transcript_416/g.998  ORF Transcript_416/g.998 Transcript_416/m.998 type:complete len:302 (+) Transcript_416:1336-2241(+)
MKLLALIHQIIVVNAIVSNKVSILIAWIDHTGCAVMKVVEDVIELRQGIFLGILPPIPTTLVGNATKFVYQHQGSRQAHFMKCQFLLEIVIGSDTEFIVVESQLESSLGLWSHTDKNRASIVMIGDFHAIGCFRNVRQAGQCHDVFVFVNGPRMTNNLLEKGMEILSVDPHELPLRLGIVTIQWSCWRIVCKVRIVSASFVTGIHVLGPQDPTGAHLFILVIMVAILLNSIIATIKKGSQHSVGHLPLVILTPGIFRFGKFASSKKFGELMVCEGMMRQGRATRMAEHLLAASDRYRHKGG